MCGQQPVMYIVCHDNYVDMHSRRDIIVIVLLWDKKIMKLRNSNYRLEGLVGYEHRETLKRLSDSSGVQAETIVSFVLDRLYELPPPTHFRLLTEYQQLLESSGLELAYPS